MEENKQNKELRQNLRANLTPAEVKLWQHLKSKQLGGYKWRRQHPVGNYILDYYCPKAKLCIELDGKSHFSIDGTNADEIRTNYLFNCGIKVIRFENKEIWENPDKVLEYIHDQLKRRS